MKSDDPCYECNKRTIGCHSKCDEYIEWAKKRREVNEKISTDRKLNALVIGHVVNSIRRNRKHRHR